MKRRQAHPAGSLERTWFRRGPLPRPYEWMRADPDYDDPLPSPLFVMAVMVPTAIAVVLAGIVVVGFLLAVLK